jgi:hypothetical protein
MTREEMNQAIRSIHDQVATHLADRSGTWLASFAELVAMAGDSGVPTGGLQPVLDRLLGRDAAGEVLEHEERRALVDALVGRWAATCYLARES